MSLTALLIDPPKSVSDDTWNDRMRDAYRAALSDAAERIQAEFPKPTPPSTR